MARGSIGKASNGTGADPAGPFAGLRFAVYARKSTEDARHEDHKSTTRQIEQATRYVETRGGEMLPEHRYTDEASSGAEFQERPGLLRFLNVLENGRPFTALVMMDDDRLGRDQYRTNYVLQQIVDKGVRVFCYLDGGREITLENETAKFMQSVRSFGAALEREKARQRCRDASDRRARRGHVAGGRCFGYQNIAMKGDRPAEPGEPHDYVLRRVKEDEATIVRGIFRAFADGWGMVKIAKTLSLAPGYADLSREYFGGQRILPPRQRTTGWDPMTIRQILYRRLYRGEMVWGKTIRTDRAGRAGVMVKRDPSEWLRRDAEDLRILDEALWTAVQTRLKAQQDTYLRDTRGKLWGKPDVRREGQYLLSGLAQCQACGANVTVLGGNPRVYGCRHHEERGTCTNTLTQRVDRVDATFLAALERELLQVEGFRWAIHRAAELVQEELAREPDRVGILERERATLQQRIGRLVAAIGDGKGPAALVKEIAAAEARVTDIETELARLQAGPTLGALDLKRIERNVAAQLSRFGALLRGNVPRARQALKKLLVDRVAFCPVDAGGGRQTYAFTGEFSYGAVLRDVVSLPNVTPGESGDRRAATGNPLASGAKTPNNP